mmetsp:Transcript_5525/g.7613  ORF Transcript_5525/g.7613 Transcript_5525/m.7613 type:complete len:818 (+) Transcript_5525:114-2567(+)
MNDMRSIRRKSFLFLPFFLQLVFKINPSFSIQPSHNSAPSKYFIEESEDDSLFTDKIPKEYFDKLSKEEISELIESVRSIFPKDQKLLREKAAKLLKHLDEEQLQDLKFEIEDTDLSKLGDSTEELLESVDELMNEGRLSENSKSIFKDILLEEDLLDSESTDGERIPYDEEPWYEATEHPEIEEQWQSWTDESGIMPVKSRDDGQLSDSTEQPESYLSQPQSEDFDDSSFDDNMINTSPSNLQENENDNTMVSDLSEESTISSDPIGTDDIMAEAQSLGEEEVAQSDRPILQRQNAFEMNFSEESDIEHIQETDTFLETLSSSDEESTSTSDEEGQLSEKEYSYFGKETFTSAEGNDFKDHEQNQLDGYTDTESVDSDEEDNGSGSEDNMSDSSMSMDELSSDEEISSNETEDTEEGSYEEVESDTNSNLNVPYPPFEVDESLDLSKESAWVGTKKSRSSQPAREQPKSVVALALELKEEANQLHREKDFHGAITTYEDCCLVLEEATDSSARSVLRSCKLSLALCYLKVEEYDNAEAECTEILQMGASKAVQQKAFFRRAKARERLGLTALAYRDLKTASNLGIDENISKMLAQMQEEHGPSIIEDAEALSDEEEYPVIMESSGPPSLFSFGKGSNGMMDGLFGKSGAGGPMGDMSGLLDLAGKMGPGALGPGGLPGGLASLLGQKGNGTNGLLSAVGDMLEKPETQSMICNFLKGSKPESLKSMGSMAGINLSDSAADRLHRTISNLEPENISKMVKAAKLANSIMKKIKQIGKMIKKSRPFLIYGFVLLWLYATFKSLYHTSPSVVVDTVPSQ